MRCNAITGGGERCKLDATHGSYCWSHAPEMAEERRRRARRGGKSGGRGRSGVGELSGLKAQLQDLTTDVLSGDVETGRAAVANQLINTRLRAVELERKIREAEDFEVRLEALEKTSGGSEARAGKGAKPWGA